MFNENITSSEPSVKVRVLQFAKSSKPSLLAVAKVELTFGDDIVTVDDVRILKNRNNTIWIALPAHSVPTSGKAFEYAPSVTLSRSLFREVEDLVISGYEKWSQVSPAVDVNSPK